MLNFIGLEGYFIHNYSQNNWIFNKTAEFSLKMNLQVNLCAPNLLGRLNHQPQLGALRFHRDVIAVHRAAKATLG